MSDKDKIIPFQRPNRTTGSSTRVPDGDVIGLVNFCKMLGVEDIHIVQALRIKQGLSGLKGEPPTKNSINEQAEVLAHWSDEECLNHAKASEVTDWKVKPAFYHALVDRLMPK